MAPATLASCPKARRLSSRDGNWFTGEAPCPWVASRRPRCDAATAPSGREQTDLANSRCHRNTAERLSAALWSIDAGVVLGTARASRLWRLRWLAIRKRKLRLRCIVLVLDHGLARLRRSPQILAAHCCPSLTAPASAASRIQISSAGVKRRGRRSIFAGSARRSVSLTGRSNANARPTRPLRRPKVASRCRARRPSRRP